MLKKKLKTFLYSNIRYSNIFFMEKLRCYFYRWLGFKIGKSSIIKCGGIIDCWDGTTIGQIGENVLIGENNAVSGGVQIGNNTSINSNVHIIASPPTQIIIGNDCLIAQNVVIRSDDHKFDDSNTLIRNQGRIGRGINIGNNCWIGANAVILKGVSIGEHSVVGAGSVVTKSFPSYSVVVGNPAKLIKKIKINL